MKNIAPAPWRVDTETSIRRFCDKTGKPLMPINYHWVKDANENCVTLFCGNSLKEAEYARLFAAGPEMLEMLKEWLQCGVIDPRDDERAKRTFALIAKVTAGEE
jgi:hypothetical protein